MQLGAYEIAIIGVAGTIAGALIGAWITYRFALSLSQVAAEREAIIKFRAAFKEELLALDTALTENYIDTCDLLKAAFEKHRLAVFDFRPFLKGKRQEEFDQAWRNYYGYDDDQNVKLEFLLKYSGKGYGGEESRNRRAVAVANIEKLLEFAKHK